MNRTKPESNRSEEQKLLFGTAPYINPIAACYSRCIRLRVAFFFEGICGEAFEQGWVCHALVQNRVTAVTAVYFGLTASLILSQGLQIAPFWHDYGTQVAPHPRSFCLLFYVSSLHFVALCSDLCSPRTPAYLIFEIIWSSYTAGPIWASCVEIDSHEPFFCSIYIEHVCKNPCQVRHFCLVGLVPQLSWSSHTSFLL